MDLQNFLCLDCPTPYLAAIANAGLALLALWTGRRLRQRPRRAARWAGLALLLLAGLIAIFLSLSVSLYGIDWPGLHPWVMARRRGLDALFLALMLGLLTFLLSRTRGGGRRHDES